VRGTIPGITERRARDPPRSQGVANRTTLSTVRGNGRLISSPPTPCPRCARGGSRPTARRRPTCSTGAAPRALADPGVDGVLSYPRTSWTTWCCFGAVSRTRWCFLVDDRERPGRRTVSMLDEQDDRRPTAAATARRELNGGKCCAASIPAILACQNASPRWSRARERSTISAQRTDRDGSSPVCLNAVDGKVLNDLPSDAVIKSIHNRQGLGSTSSYTPG